jgi:F-type H+-transporting ATPase subunit epsilon
VAHARFPVEVLTPEGEVFSEDAEMVSTRTTVGSIGLLANHEPLLGTLVPTELRIYRSETDIVRFAAAEGYVQFAGNKALILVEEALTPDQLDRAALESKLADAQAQSERAEDGSEEQARAQREARRYEAFLAIGA